jgi:hypothetical protein
VHVRPLTRLRLWFVALGVLLLTPLGFLLDAVDERVEAQRRLRHEVVAERIFDELERELTALLDAESARPSAAYDEPTRVEAWAPYVVGYFKLGAAGVELLARDQIDAARSARLTAALGTLAGAKRQRQEPSEELGATPSPATLSPTSLPPPRQKAFEPKSSPDVLQKLNRSQEERERSNVSRRPSKSIDPMQRY